MKDLYFFIGTEAELIKIFPVIIECKKAGCECHVIASGQNDIKNSVIFKYTDCSKVELELSTEDEIRKSAHGLFRWWIKTYRNAGKIIKDNYREKKLSGSYMIVHGDTVSTFMGALLGRKLGMIVCHVEAGLRSHHMFNPFPEEIDRLLTSRIARVHFAPGDEAIKNLKNVKGNVFNTIQNTLHDSLEISANIEACEIIKRVLENRKPYFVFVIHRQENVANEKLLREAIANIMTISKDINVIVILHTITKMALVKYGLLEQLEQNENVEMLDRVDYFSFMKLLNGSEFVITDGGSNQEELYYMGKPTLIMRKKTERSEGIGLNAILYSNVSDMLKFAKNYHHYQNMPLIIDKPSFLIAQELMKLEG